MPNDDRIEEVAGVMYATTKGYYAKVIPWAECDEDTKQYWRNMAKVARNIFDRADAEEPN